MPKPIRNFFWPITDRCTRDQLELFVRLSIVRGVHHSVVLSQLVRDYNKRFLECNRFLAGVRLADEKELMSHLRKAGTPVSRVLLMKYRESDRLRSTTVPLFWTDGKRLVYNLRGCREFFRQRHKTA